MTDTAIQVSSSFMPLMTVGEAGQRRQALVEFTRSIMVPGTDFGVIPGTGTKPVLLKAGAEKLTTFFGLAVKFIREVATEDWTGEGHGGEPFFHYGYKCQLWRGDLMVADGDGSCNSWEKKYRYRSGERVCPECGKVAIIKGKAEFGGGWLCFKKKGGCGFKWVDGAKEIEGQEVGQIKNDNPADLVNTILKMAQKRALVAAVLVGVNASEFFTQDIEDMDFGGVIEGTFTTPSEPAGKTGRETQVGMTLEKALAFTTPKGTLFANLTEEQLTRLLKTELGEPAKIILAEYRNIESQAVALADQIVATGGNPSYADGLTYSQLRDKLKELSTMAGQASGVITQEPAE